MIDSRLVKLVIQLTLGVGLILAAMLLIKTQSMALSNLIPTLRPDGTLKSYHGRMQATERTPRADEFDNIYGHWGTTAQRSHRSKSS